MRNDYEKIGAVYRAFWEIDLTEPIFIKDAIEKISKDTDIEKEEVNRILYELFETGFFRNVEILN